MHGACRASTAQAGRAPTLSELAGWRYVVADSNATGHGINTRQLEELHFAQDVAVRLPYFTIACHIAQHTDPGVLIPRGIAECLNRGRAFRILPLPFALQQFEVQMHSHSQFASDPGLAWLRALIHDKFGQGERQQLNGRTVRSRPGSARSGAESDRAAPRLAARTVLQGATAWGGRHRKSPTGGVAKGMPLTKPHRPT